MKYTSLADYLGSMADANGPENPTETYRRDYTDNYISGYVHRGNTCQAAYAISIFQAEGAFTGTFLLKDDTWCVASYENRTWKWLAPASPAEIKVLAEEDADIWNSFDGKSIGIMTRSPIFLFSGAPALYYKSKEPHSRGVRIASWGQVFDGAPFGWIDHAD